MLNLSNKDASDIHRFSKKKWILTIYALVEICEYQGHP